jgi:ferredoxin
MRVRKEIRLRENDVFRTGPIVFRFNERPAPTRSHVTVVVTSKPMSRATGVENRPAAAQAPRPASPQAPPQAPPAAGNKPAAPPPAVTTGPVVTFKGTEGAFPVGPSESILSVARKNKIPINYECESGRCGYDPVRIVSGQEHLNELDEDEEGWTLQEVCHLEPGPHRLACVLRTRGPIVVETIKK